MKRMVSNNEYYIIKNQLYYNIINNSNRTRSTCSTKKKKINIKC